MDKNTLFDEADEICAKKLLRDHARYLKLVDQANTSRIEFLVAGEKGVNSGWKRIVFRQLYQGVSLWGVIHFITASGGSPWMGLVLLMIVLELMHLNSRTDALAELREDFPQGWPMMRRRDVEPVPAKPVAESSSSLPG